MSSERISIFYTGATGYIGGAVLQRISEHPKANTFDITALVRNADKAKLIEATLPHVKTVVGALQDLDKLTELSAQSHVVIHTANCDDEPAMKAILAGLKKRHETIGDTPILIHTSGLAVLVDDARGEYTSQTITSDLDLAALDALPPSALHHVVDLLAISASTEGYARSYLVFPGLIYGIAKGPLFDGGISHKHSLAIPWLTTAFAKRGRAGMLGTGASMWPNVHIADTAEFYYLLFDAALSDPSKLSHGREGYYFVEADEHKAYDAVKAVGSALVDLGKAKDAEPTVLTPEECVEYFGSDFMAGLLFTNARCRADRGRRDLGWKPKYTTQDLVNGIKEEVEVLLRE
ncbi:NAD(P)-binding protein [Daedaleopsis nitida]|nr:NAD(P)-binding protein [Daedaleopsis nitida]